MPVLTVSQLNHYVSLRFAEDPALRMVLLRGEIANFTQNFRSGHCYFSLRDEEASVRAVMFRSHAARLQFAPQNGMVVLLQGAVTVYERDGVYQLNVTDMQPDGVGAQALALQQRREKLRKLGYFDPEHKRQLPSMPKKIGIVTSRSGAALQDMLQILTRRYPLGSVCIYPATVQGEQAPRSIAEALTIAGNDGCDVILMGRGGGSSEDLAAFQSEEVAHAVYHAKAPVVSAVGHETDHCIADEIADLRAPTPSAAAELAVPDIRALMQLCERRLTALNSAFLSLCSSKEAALERLKNRLELQAVDRQVVLQEERFSKLMLRFRNAMEQRLAQYHQQWIHVTDRLEAVSPVAILRRGYALVYREDTLVRSADMLQIGDTLTIQLADGRCKAAVTESLPDA